MSAAKVYRSDELTQVGDVELVDEIYDLVRTLDDDRLADNFYFLLQEAFERFAPHVELEVVRRSNVDEHEGLRHSIERMGRMHALRLTAAAKRQEA